MVRVLPENDNLGLFRGTMIKGIENEFSRRIYLRGLVLVFHELDQLGEIRFLKFIFLEFFPRGLDFYVNHRILILDLMIGWLPISWLGDSYITESEITESLKYYVLISNNFGQCFPVM